MSVDVVQNNRRIAKNTMFLYFRMLITLFVGLYTSRVVLATLGISDYGLYSVVAGVIGMFGFLTGMLSAGTQRFITYEIGTGDLDNLKKVFSTALCMYLMLSGVVLLLGETIGLWFVSNKMNFEPDRHTAAICVYQFTVVTAIVALIQAPFMASLIAHEKMDIYAYMSLYDVTMKLIIVYLIRFTSHDRLIVYGFLYMLVSLSSTIIYNVYCHRNYQECRFRFSLDRESFKKMFSFSAWDMVGNLAGICQTQGVSIVLNIFCGTVVNAAQGIANQVNGIIMQFVNNFQVAVNPQVVKYYASGRLDDMVNLVFNSAKYGAYLVLLFSIPTFIEAEYILTIWLGEYPPLAPVMLRIMLLQSFFQSLGIPTVKAVHAVGRLKEVNLTVGIMLLAILPICYFMLKAGTSPEVTVLASVLPWLFAIPLRLFWLKRFCYFPAWQFMGQVILKVFIIAGILFTLPYAVKHFIPLGSDLTEFFVVGTVSVIWTAFVIYFFGLHKAARKELTQFVLRKLKLAQSND